MGCKLFERDANISSFCLENCCYCIQSIHDRSINDRKVRRKISWSILEPLLDILRIYFTRFGWHLQKAVFVLKVFRSKNDLEVADSTTLAISDNRLRLWSTGPAYVTYSMVDWLILDELFVYSVATSFWILCLSLLYWIDWRCQTEWGWQH